MEDLVKPAIQSVLVDVINYTQLVSITYAHWLNNIRDWNISRQLVTTNSNLFLRRRKEDFVVAEYRRSFGFMKT
jgi:valyl-tRNA synthetase